MHMVILITHIVFMSASLIFMTGAVAMALLGARVAVKVSTAGMITTVGGFLTGGLLLLSAPLTFQCVTLTAYLLAMVALYRYGFGMGRVENARLVRGV